MSPRPILRQAETADYAAILALNESAIPAVNRITEAELSVLHAQSLALLAAGPPDDLGGFMLLLGDDAEYTSPNYRWFRGRYTRFAYVDRVVVSPRRRRSGLATAFYDGIPSHAAGCDLIACEVNTEPPNPASAAFHLARGFVAVGEQETEGGAKRVSLLVKPLTERGAKRIAADAVE